MNEPSRMDEAWVTPKSLLNYREIQLSEHQIGEKLQGAVQCQQACIWRVFSPLYKLHTIFSQSAVCCFHYIMLASSVVDHFSNSLYFINIFCPSLFIPHMANFGLGIKTDKKSSIGGGERKGIWSQQVAVSSTMRFVSQQITVYDDRNFWNGKVLTARDVTLNPMQS